MTEGKDNNKPTVNISSHSNDADTPLGQSVTEHTITLNLSESDVGVLDIRREFKNLDL